MKVAVLSESSADEAAIRILIEGICSHPTEPVLPAAIRARGWEAVLASLPPILSELHYHTDAEALVVVLDSNGSPIHSQEHEQAGGADPDCRLCLLRARVAATRSKLRARLGQPELKTALGLAVPAIEAWYLCGRNKQVGEAGWLTRTSPKKAPYTVVQLKREVYGSERYSLPHETECAVSEARRVAANISALLTAFPVGFGSLHREVSGWGPQPPSAAESQ
jgi:hypothetical protein